MSGGLTFEVEHGHPVVLRATGALDAVSAPDLRAALLGCVARQPAAVVLDTAAMTVADEIGLTALAGVARASRDWPGTALAVTGTGEFEAAWRRMGLQGQLSLCPDLATARAELGQVAQVPIVRTSIVADRDAPGLARAVVQDFCRAQQVGGDRDAAQLVASELVTNAVVHTHTDIELTLRLVHPLLHIAVRDGGEGRPRITDVVDESAESGRGLLLVDALASGWGTFYPESGKIVWATVRVRSLTSAQ